MRGALNLLTPKPRRLAERIAVIAVGLAWCCSAGLLLVAASRLLLHDRWMVLVWLNAGTLYLYLPAYGCLVLAALYRRWLLASVSGLIVGFHLAWVAPDLRRSEPVLKSSTGPVLRVFSSNLLMVNPRPDWIIDELLRSKADVVLLQEFSSAWDEALHRRGVFERYPHYHGEVREDSFGTAILSMRPLRRAETWDVAGLPMTRASVVHDERELQIINVHVLPPRTRQYTAIWHNQMAIVLDAIRITRAPLLVAGDFNATQHSVWYARLMNAGLRDAHRLCGRGLSTTFPNGVFPLPPLRLDHALLSRDLACHSIREGEGRFSDHKPLIFDVAFYERK